MSLYDGADVRRRRLLLVAGIVITSGVGGALALWVTAELGAEEYDFGVPVRDVTVLLSSDVRSEGLPSELTSAWTAGDPTSAVPPRSRAVRMGAINADLTLLAIQRNMNSMAAYYQRDSLALAVVAENSRRIEALAREMDGYLQRWPDGAQAAVFYREVERRAVRQATFGSELWDAQANSRLYQRPFHIAGSWLECARIAAARQDTTFFRHPTSLIIVAGAERLPKLRRRDREALGKLHALMDSAADLDVHAIGVVATEALRALAH